LNNPKVSVIIPVYNGEKFLEEAIKSVLNQDYDHLECIVVDDGSTDESASIAKKFERVIYLRQDNTGVASARNRGVQRASGEYLAFLDADDIWDINKLETQINYMEENPDIDYSVTRHRLFLAEGLKELPPWVRKNHYEKEMVAYIPSALIVRRSAFEIVGNFDESYRIADDSDWFMRARDAGIKLGFVGKNLLYKRVHSQCLTSQIDVTQKEMMKSIKASLQRTKSVDKVSVIVPVYNGDKYLREALDSVLNQSVRPFEVLVIDDGSTDTTAEIARQYGERIHYIRRNNGGAAAARNDGVKSAVGNYIAFLDADDYWDKQKLALQLREIKKPGAANMIFGMVSQFYSPETDENFRQQYQCPSQPTKGAHCGIMLMKREDFLKVGFFSTEYKTGEFIEWYQRAKEAGMTLAFLPDILMHRRIHPLNHGIVQKQHTHDFARVVKEMLLRKRKKEADGQT
jgi:glycosyltransferase involved in cell wall biosynthesis